MSTADDLEQKVDLLLENIKLKEELGQLEEAKKQIAKLEDEVQRCQAKGFGDLKEGVLRVLVFSPSYHYDDQRLGGILVQISNEKQEYHLTTGTWRENKFYTGYCETQQPIPPGNYIVTADGFGKKYQQQITVNGNTSMIINLDSPKRRKRFSLMLGFLAGLAAGGIVGYTTSRQISLASMDYKPGYVGVRLLNERGQEDSTLTGLPVEIYDGKNSYHLTTGYQRGNIWKFENGAQGYAETQTEIPGGDYFILVRSGNNLFRRNITVNKNTYVDLQLGSLLPILLR